jgi:hypothetical protein
MSRFTFDAIAAPACYALSSCPEESDICCKIISSTSPAR